DRFRKREVSEVVEVERGQTRVAERPAPPRTGGVAREAVTIVYRVSRAVFLLLAVVVVLGIVFTVAPTNAENVIVRNVLSLARDAAGPFRDVFTVADNAERELVVNYAFAAVVYFVVSVVVGKLPGGKR
ncbi:MAG: hypothetical protein H7323_05160, partial [Frankiales bacterium]|nr:hypothetical protein [Frankiales bacterium]